MLSLIAALAVSSSATAKPAPFLMAPAGRQYARVVPGGRTILPNGRYLTPKGTRLYTGDDLWHCMVSPDGKLAIGFHDGGVTYYREPAQSAKDRKRVAIKDVAPTGAFLKGGRELLVSDGDEGSLSIYSTETWERVREIEINADGVKDCYINDLAVEPTERYAYGVDIAHQTVVTVDLSSGKVVSRVKAGREPYAICWDKATSSLFVANIGLFDYSVVPKPEDGKGSPRGLSIPAFGFPSKDAETGRRMEGRDVPGLGSPYVPDAQSIYRYSLKNPAKPALDKSVKAGLLIHAPADGGKSVGGSAPNAFALARGKLYVSNANNDTIQVFDPKTLKLAKTIKIEPSPLVARYRGVIPNAMAVSKDEKRLYVCESGLNAVGVIDTATNKVLGHIPTGWFPTRVCVSPDGKRLYIATQKGIGRGPRGVLTARTAEDERYGLSDMPGMIDRVAIPTDAELQKWSREVRINNGLYDQSEAAAKLPKGPVPLYPGKPSEQIKYVVFITKENHTFDGIFGELKERGARGEPSYGEFGTNGWIKEKGKEERLPIMPNHIALANQFAISDNFYMEPQASGDGHRWLVGVYPSLWTSRVFYAGWDFKLSDETKGRLVSFGSNGSQIPEDYLENGSLWEHLSRNGISFRNYGEGYELPDNDEGPMENRSGAYTRVNYPMPKALYENTCFNFPAYNNNIPDIARADWFIEDIEKNFRSKGKPLPRFINIAICNDHGARARPDRGYPFVCSYMADNDLALGRIVEYLSRQPEWKNMAIFVTQDDSGADDDHIDRHRSFVLAISPWAKREYIARDHTSIMSIIRTIYLIFGLGPNNMFDAVATPLHEMFTLKPDYRPYTHLPTDPRVFKPEATFDPDDPGFKKRRTMPSVRMDDPDFMEWLRKRG